MAVETYKAKEGERLDQIIFDKYGSLEHVETILKNNPQLLGSLYLEAEELVYFILDESKQVEMVENESNEETRVEIQKVQEIVRSTESVLPLKPSEENLKSLW